MRKNWAAWVMLGLGALLLLAFFLHNGHSPFPRCYFHEWTGLYCAGCGTTRATYAQLDGRFADAFRFNPLWVILLPIIALGIIGWVRGIRLEVGPRGAWMLGGIVLSFMVLRNCPVWPFTLLAPP